METLVLYLLPIEEGAVTQEQDPFVGWITSADAASKLGVTQRRIRQMVDEGLLIATKISNRWFVSERSIKAYQTKKEKEQD